MKKTLQGLLAAALLVSAAHASTHSNKTFLRPRPVLVNKAMQFTTWHEEINKKADGKFGGSIAVTGFYQSSTNRRDLGRYFGGHNPECPCGSNTCGDCNDSCDTSCKSLQTRSCTSCGQTSCDCDTSCNRCAFDNIDVSNTTVSSSEARDLMTFDVLHNPWASVVANDTTRNTPEIRAAMLAMSLGGTAQLRPEINTWGFRLDYNQDLDKLVDGLYFRVSTAIANVETCVKPRLCSGNKLAATTFPNVTTVSRLAAPGSDLLGAMAFDFGSNNGKSVLDYLAGNLSQTANPLIDTGTASTFTSAREGTALVQDKLCKLVIPCDCDDSTGLADIEIVLGYNIIHEADKHIGINLGLVIPTGDSADSHRLFEAIVGNGQHWAFGAGFDTKFNLWHSDDTMLDLILALDYRFLFEDSERRVVGFKGSDGKVVNHGWYRLFGKVGESKVFPGANVLCQKVDVEPGSQVDFIAGLSLQWSDWTFDLGYELFAQESEDVCFAKNCWTDNTYGLIVDNYDPTIIAVAGTQNTLVGPVAFAQGSTTQIPAFEGNVAINRTDLCTNVAETPSQVTHKIYGGVGYTFRAWNYPFLMGAGASMEWADSNSAADQWGIWAKLGVSF